MKFVQRRMLLIAPLLVLFTMTNTFSQSLKQMIADNQILTDAYWKFLKTEYTWYDGNRAKLRMDHYVDGSWRTEELKQAILSFQSKELKNAMKPLDEFERKYGDGDRFMKKFQTDFDTQMKALSSKTSDRLERIRIESDFKNEHQLTGSTYYKYKEKIDAFASFKESLANDIYAHALTYEERIGKYNREVIIAEMKKLLQFVLWINPGHAAAQQKLNSF